MFFQISVTFSSQSWNDSSSFRQAGHPVKHSISTAMARVGISTLAWRPSVRDEILPSEILPSDVGIISDKPLHMITTQKTSIMKFYNHCGGHCLQFVPCFFWMRKKEDNLQNSSVLSFCCKLQSRWIVVLRSPSGKELAWEPSWMTDPFPGWRGSIFLHDKTIQIDVSHGQNKRRPI